MGSEPTTAAEMVALKRELEQVKTRVGQLEQQRNDAIGALANATGLTRRQVLGIIGGGAGMGALGVLASGQAQAAASDSDSEGDIGSPTTPVDALLNGLAFDAEDISSATTVSRHVVRYDCSVSGFTITLDSALEGPSGFAQPVVLIDDTGSAGTNSVTVDTQSGNNIDGGANITVNHDNAITILFWDGSEWRSTRFVDTVDVRVATVTDLRQELQQPQDVTASRSSGTWETNNTNYPLIVMVTANTSGSDGDSAFVGGHINTSQSDNVVVENETQASTAQAVTSSITMVVPPGHDYKAVIAGTGTQSLRNWFEQTLGVA